MKYSDRQRVENLRETRGNVRIDSKSAGEEALHPLRYFAFFLRLHDLRHKAAHRLCGFILLLEKSFVLREILRKCVEGFLWIAEKSLSQSGLKLLASSPAGLSPDLPSQERTQRLTRANTGEFS